MAQFDNMSRFYQRQMGLLQEAPTLPDTDFAARMAQLSTLNPSPYHDSSAGSGLYGTTVDRSMTAGFWIRVGAYLIDGVILFIPNLILGQIATGLAGPPVATDMYGMATTVNTNYYLLDFVFLFLLHCIYFGTFWTTNGQTPGMRVAGIRVQSESGDLLSWGQAIGRVILLYVSFACFCLGVLWVAFTDDKRGWHDLGCGSEVVRIS
jgi:uncharacterized RDD family membrane protein YckC